MGSVLYMMVRTEGIPEVYGGEKSTITTAQVARELGHGVHFAITGDDALTNELRAAGFQAELIPVWNPLSGARGAERTGKLRRLMRFAEANRAVYRACRRGTIGIVHANGVPAVLCSWLGARLAGATVAFHVRDLSAKRRLRWYEALTILLATRTLVITPSLRDALLEGAPPRLRQVLARRMTTLLNAIDFDLIDAYAARVSRNEARARLGVAGDQACILLVGSVEKRKGQRYFLDEVLPLTTAESVVVMFPGGVKDVAYEEACRRVIETRHPTRRVHWAGYIERDELFMMYRAADVSIVASESEGLSRAAVESLAFGVPVVTKAIAGPIDVVEDGVTGFIVPPNDPSFMAKRIDEVLADRALAVRFGEQGRRSVREKFSVQGHREELEKIYRDLFDRARVGPPRR